MKKASIAATKETFNLLEKFKNLSPGPFPQT
jgi:hypothetical protein